MCTCFKKKKNRKENLTELKGKTDKSTIIFEDFNSPTLVSNIILA